MKKGAAPSVLISAMIIIIVGILVLAIFAPRFNTSRDTFFDTVDQTQGVIQPDEPSAQRGQAPASVEQAYLDILRVLREIPADGNYCAEGYTTANLRGYTMAFDHLPGGELEFTLLNPAGQQIRTDSLEDTQLCVTRGATREPDPACGLDDPEDGARLNAEKLFINYINPGSRDSNDDIVKAGLCRPDYEVVDRGELVDDDTLNVGIATTYSLNDNGITLNGESVNMFYVPDDRDNAKKTVCFVTTKNDIFEGCEALLTSSYSIDGIEDNCVARIWTSLDFC